MSVADLRRLLESRLRQHDRAILPSIHLLFIRERYRLRFPCLYKFSTNLYSISAE